MTLVVHTTSRPYIARGHRLGMALKASNVVGDPVTLHRIWRILMVRRIDDYLVLGPDLSGEFLW
jgi:hypothetical protein